jgi:NLI interacting factor-like phosphatase
MLPSRPTIVALDLEGTLISNAVSQIPRPGLYQFLANCQEIFSRVVVFTSVKEPQFRSIASILVTEGAAPRWFTDVEYIVWQGQTKDLNFIANALPADVILVDDYEEYVHPGQESQYLRIEQFEHPYATCDQGLEVAISALRQLVKDRP